ncbi:MAG: bifunctional heptose 7-phosphate kinase/heptose 1-phosphate adenyltransferase [Alphaproteobacteria bacterium 41-28]|nr:MAG: bifunctional heptose 7-phosphate kinase/heptose 1-phosphate adenyltransferase [Alphaproteobacteria bacterium 41-28]
MNDSHLINSFSSTRILCVGDAMLDQFVRGTVSRISPEAPVPVLHIKDESTVLGGAGNVVRNLEALGSTITFISVVGKDRDGSHIQELLKSSSKVDPYLIFDETRTTTRKTRFIAANQQVLRTDWEKTLPLKTDIEVELFNIYKKHLPSHQLIILSDYAKGIFSPQLLGSLIQEARAQGKPILVDPKGNDYDRYKGATFLTPNRNELSLATRTTIQTQEELVSVTQDMIRACELDAMIVTRGSEGMTLVEASGAIEHLQTQALEVFDVSGAGDTVMATLAVSLAAGATLSKAMHLANAAAGLVVAKIGTAVVHQEELLTALHAQDSQNHEKKIVSRETAREQIQKWKRHGNRVVFTNGCFDLLHPGHIFLLNEAKKAGDRLVLGLNTDSSVQRLKGPTRPIQQERDRAFVLSSLQSIDLIVLFDEDTPLELIQVLKPDVLVKGSDYTIDKVVGAPFVQSYGGEVLLIDLIEGQSTTRMVTKMAV